MTETKSNHLNSPRALPCGGVLPNRIAKSAMSERLAASDGSPGPKFTRLYEQWADGGAGLLITGNVMIDGDAIAEPGNAVLERGTPLEPFAKWARATGDTPTWMQINHPGRQVPRFVSSRPVAPSPVAMSGLFGAFARPRKLTGEEIEELIERFATTAALAKKAGFDGVQIHGAHGYLVSQFLSPRTNRRTDDWGGSPEKRRRFLVEIVRAVRRRVGEDFPVGVKLNSADFQRGGFSESASMEVVGVLEREGVDLLEISGGTYEKAEMFSESKTASDSTRRREAFFMEYAEKVRRRTELPLMVTGGFRSRAAMDDALASGAIDVVGMARPLAVEPDLPARLLASRTEKARSVDLSTGFKKLDGFVQGTWYQAQLARLAAGRRPDPALSRLRAAVGYFTVSDAPAAKREKDCTRKWIGSDVSPV